ncbi:hypothetical protein FACS1894103_2040 [Campylobacterota bacterium]|nr:hypothetical protein FACS1894103_2040 [Campylobacterota bacterium]
MFDELEEALIVQWQKKLLESVDEKISRLRDGDQEILKEFHEFCDEALGHKPCGGLDG